MTDQKRDAPKKPECEHCGDSGLYDACCRPHACDCPAGDKYRKAPLGGAYGDYPNLRPSRFR